MEGKTVMAEGSTEYLGALKDVHIDNVVYAYDTIDGTTIMLGHNNTIYLGYQMEDFLGNTIQYEYNGIRVGTIPKRYYITRRTVKL